MASSECIIYIVKKTIVYDPKANYLFNEYERFLIRQSLISQLLLLFELRSNRDSSFELNDVQVEVHSMNILRIRTKFSYEICLEIIHPF